LISDRSRLLRRERRQKRRGRRHRGLERLSVYAGWGDKAMMSYEKLDVYQCSIQFLAEAIKLANELLRGGHSAVTDQFKRAAMSIPLNASEGAGIKGSNSYHNCVIVKIARHCTRSTIPSQFFLCDSLNSFAPLNKTHKADGRKYFDIARGSAMECGATIDVCHILGLVSDVKKTQT
jgi:hypothetical protein